MWNVLWPARLWLRALDDLHAIGEAGRLLMRQREQLHAVLPTADARTVSIRRGKAGRSAVKEAVTSPREHLAQEEREVLPKIGSALDDQQLREHTRARVGVS